MIFQTPAPDAGELAVHRAVDQLREKLAYATRSRRWVGLLSRVTMARVIQGSNSIEGFNVSVQDALAAVDGDQPLDASGDTWAAILGDRNAMAYVLQLADDEHFRYSPDLIRSLHFTMTGYDLAKRPGRWRSADIFVQNEAAGERVYEGPDGDLAPGLVDELVSELNGNSHDPVMVRAAMAHLNLVMIHPFSDGNGRMARCLQSLVLARRGIVSPEFLSIEEYLGRNRQSYFEILASVGAGRWNPDRDARPWVRFCLTAHYRQAMTLLRRSREYHRLFDAVDELIDRFALAPRVFSALADAAQGFRVVNARYRSEAEISQSVASRDLAHLCGLGLLDAHGARRGRFYSAAPLVIELRQKTREPRLPISDPFSLDPGDLEQLTLPG